ncbi:MbtH family protein [Streptomyces sp. NPDC051561]|uniref:MbtH family protein n=1 Tax=Streptomyces sp. NPDC051561 TaxID=3365658 RepID=UPI0037A7F880
MATNPFDDPDGTYQVLVNDEGQHSLWPAAQDAPAGWTVALAATSKQACTDHIESHWTDLRPRSVAEAMARAETGGRS